MPRSPHGARVGIAAAVLSFALQSSFDAKPPPFSDQQSSEPAPIAFGDNINSPETPEGIVATTGGTVEVKVGANGDTFTPSTVNITIGDTVHWTWVGFGHTVTS